MGKFGQQATKFSFHNLSRLAHQCHSQISLRFTDWSYYSRGEASVLMLIANTPKPSVLFTERSSSLRRHPGQICFPGGLLNSHEDPLACAFRETEEELSFLSEIDWPPKVIGSIGAYPNRPSKLKVHSYLAYLGDFNTSHNLVAPKSLEEVESAQFISLDELNNPQFETIEKGWHEMPYYNVGKTRIWGMTAYILHEFLSKLNRNE